MNSLIPDRTVETRFKRARILYTAAVEQLYNHEFLRRGYGYLALDIAPQTIEQMRQAVRSSQIVGCNFPVWKGGSEQTVFIRKETNYMFRYLHDHEHYDQRLTLSVEHERILGQRWALRVLRWSGDRDVALLAELDTVGQTEYYAQHASFPDDQLSFVFDLFKAKAV